jgi:hypothetical protein
MHASTARPGHWGRSRTTAGSLAVGAAAFALLLSGCSGGSSNKDKSVAKVNSSASSSSSSNNGGRPSAEQVKAAALAYSKCMRSHGVPQFPDPNADGGISIDGNIQQNSPQFKAADDACRHLLPAPPPGGGVPEDRAAGLKYAKCMRAHGVPKFPDPNPGGGIGIDAGKLGVDPNGPVFKAADNACKKYMGGGGGTNSHAGPGSAGG